MLRRRPIKGGTMRRLRALAVLVLGGSIASSAILAADRSWVELKSAHFTAVPSVPPHNGGSLQL
jgi:hypothetical protein